jgi:hypothetical protein
MIRIVCSGGIGDGLRNLSMIPHEWIFRRLGIRCEVVYFQIQLIDAEVAIPGASLLHAGFPDRGVFERLVERFPSLCWRGDFTGRTAGVALARLVREAIKLTHGGKPRYFPITPRLSPEEEAALPAAEGGQLVGIQTHLSGMRTKRWGAENWRTFLERLLAAQPGLRIVLLDAAEEVKTLVISDRISTSTGWNISQSVRLVQRLSLLVSVDSWSKYIAVANRIPQIIIVPDQRPEYPGESAEKLLSVAFAGVAGDPLVTLIGLEHQPPALTLPRMADLTPEELLRQVQLKFAALRAAR